MCFFCFVYCVQQWNFVVFVCVYVNVEVDFGWMCIGVEGFVQVQDWVVGSKLDSGEE